MRRRVGLELEQATPPGDTLVVVLHGCTWTSSERRRQMRGVLDAVRGAVPTADVAAAVLPIEFWSLQDADRIVSDVLRLVDQAWAAAAGRYRSVHLVGFSFGSVLVRSLYCRAAGARPDAAIDAHQVRPWARHVERIVLLAGVNRGWTTDSPVTRIESLLNGLGTAIGHLLPTKPTIFALRRGAPFLTTMRLQWLALEAAGALPPRTIQLLGTRDDIVSPEDNIDLATGAGFIYIDVPRSAHFDVIDMAPGDDVRGHRHRCFTTALIGDTPALQAAALPSADVRQLLPTGEGVDVTRVSPTAADGHVDDVVFVVHGIRDKGYWTRKIARVVVACGRSQGRRVVALTPTYGYFAMLPFVLPWTRRAKREWLLDVYVNARSAYPEAAVSFVGHRNGTYILAGALRACPAMRIANVVFAGSVVPSRFPWRLYVSDRTGMRVLNYVATRDLVVAFFPRLLNRLGVRDLGGAGFDGFTDRTAGVHDVAFVEGRHSAALDEQHWNDIAGFVLGGDPPPPQVTSRSARIRLAAAVGPVLAWVLIVSAIVAPTYALFRALGFPPPTDWSVRPSAWSVATAGTLPAWTWACLLLVWLRLLSAILTRL